MSSNTAATSQSPFLSSFPRLWVQAPYRYSFEYKNTNTHLPALLYEYEDSGLQEEALSLEQTMSTLSCIERCSWQKDALILGSLIFSPLLSSPRRKAIEKLLEDFIMGSLN